MSNIAPKKSDLLKKQISKDIVKLSDRQLVVLRDLVNKERDLIQWLLQNNAPGILISRSQDLLVSYERDTERIEKIRSSLVEIYPDELDPFTETLLQDIDKIPKMIQIQ